MLTGKGAAWGLLAAVDGYSMTAKMRGQFDLIDRGLMLDRVMRVRLQPFHVLDDLAVELVDQQIDRRIEVAVGAFDEDVLSLQMQIDFRALLSVLFLMVVDREDHSAIDDLVAMP